MVTRVDISQDCSRCSIFVRIYEFAMDTLEKPAVGGHFLRVNSGYCRDRYKGTAGHARRGACLIRPKEILYKAMKLGQSLNTFLKRLHLAEVYWQLLRRDTAEIREDPAVRLHAIQNILRKAVPLVLHPLACDVFRTSRDDDENLRGVERRINGFLKLRCTQFLEADIAHERL